MSIQPGIVNMKSASGAVAAPQLAWREIVIAGALTTSPINNGNGQPVAVTKSPQPPTERRESAKSRAPPNNQHASAAASISRRWRDIAWR